MEEQLKLEEILKECPLELVESGKKFYDLGVMAKNSGYPKIYDDVFRKIFSQVNSAHTQGKTPDPPDKPLPITSTEIKIDTTANMEKFRKSAFEVFSHVIQQICKDTQPNTYAGQYRLMKHTIPLMKCYYIGYGDDPEQYTTVLMNLPEVRLVIAKFN